VSSCQNYQTIWSQLVDDIVAAILSEVSSSKVRYNSKPFWKGLPVAQQSWGNKLDLGWGSMLVDYEVVEVPLNQILSSWVIQGFSQRQSLTKRA